LERSSAVHCQPACCPAASTALPFYPLPPFSLQPACCPAAFYCITTLPASHPPPSGALPACLPAWPGPPLRHILACVLAYPRYTTTPPACLTRSGLGVQVRGAAQGHREGVQVGGQEGQHRVRLLPVGAAPFSSGSWACAGRSWPSKRCMLPALPVEAGPFGSRSWAEGTCIMQMSENARLHGATQRVVYPCANLGGTTGDTS
jgi:hypothetical protein